MLRKVQPEMEILMSTQLAAAVMALNNKMRRETDQETAALHKTRTQIIIQSMKSIKALQSQID